MRRRALLLVDVQNDFCPGGALPVPEGDRIVPVLNQYARRFADEGRPVFASRDWHPEVTSHFMDQGGPWPPHCIADTEGAAFHPELKLPETAEVITKGTDPTDDGYSAFEAEDRQGRKFPTLLHTDNVRHLYVGGLATEYCVRASVLDGLREGLDVVVLLDAVRGIDVEEGAVVRAIDEMLRAGARTATLATIDEELK
ncbi:MAG TPA: nicotinamidase [Longimicrobiales bacterium]|nr:nicotinamidase [Longimicrobiales bacterium]